MMNLLTAKRQLRQGVNLTVIGIVLVATFFLACAALFAVKAHWKSMAAISQCLRL